MTPRLQLCLYGIVAVCWLFARDWPYGDRLQLSTDIALFAAGLLGYFNYLKKKKDRKR